MAVVEGECTIKRLVRRGSSWWLQAENPEYQDFEITDPENLHIWGVVTHIVHELIPGRQSVLLRSRD